MVCRLTEIDKPKRERRRLRKFDTRDQTEWWWRTEQVPGSVDPIDPDRDYKTKWKRRTHNGGVPFTEIQSFVRASSGWIIDRCESSVLHLFFSLNLSAYLITAAVLLVVVFRMRGKSFDLNEFSWIRSILPSSSSPAGRRIMDSEPGNFYLVRYWDSFHISIQSIPSIRPSVPTSSFYYSWLSFPFLSSLLLVTLALYFSLNLGECESAGVLPVPTTGKCSALE